MGMLPIWIACHGFWLMMRAQLSKRILRKKSLVCFFEGIFQGIDKDVQTVFKKMKLDSARSSNIPAFFIRRGAGIVKTPLRQSPLSCPAAC